MNVAVVFVGQLRGNSLVWSSLNRTFYNHHVYSSMWRPRVDAESRCSCFESIMNVRKALWMNERDLSKLAVTLTSEHLNLESYAYSISLSVWQFA